MRIDAFELEIIKKTGTKKVTVNWIEIDGPTGNFIIGPDHTPLVSLLKYRGFVKYKEHSSDKEAVETIDTYGGIFSINNNKAVIIID